MAFHYERSTRSLYTVDYPVVGRRHAISLGGAKCGVEKERLCIPKSRESIEFKVD